MAGFGDEDNHFVVELTYNYGIKEYQLGNDFQVIQVLRNFINSLFTGNGSLDLTWLSLVYSYPKMAQNWYSAK